MRHVIRLSIVAAVLVAAIAVPASAVVNPDVVKGTSLFEGYGAGTHIGTKRLFAWSWQNANGEGPITAFSEANGGTLTRVNRRGSDAFVGGYDQGTDRIVYQQVRGNESDLFMFDAGSRERTALKDLNDGHWQWNPSIDTHRGTTWIVYGVNRFGSPGAKWRLFVYNAKTGERTLLTETTNECGCLFPGTVAYPWVTWAEGTDARAWRYDIRTGERTPLFPTDRDEYAVTVTSDGTTYVAQGGDQCGANAEIYRVEPDGTPFLIHSFRPGREATNLSVDTSGPKVRLYFDRRVCRTGASDILRLRRAEEIGQPAGPARLARGAGGTGDVRRSGASEGARPRTR